VSAVSISFTQLVCDTCGKSHQGMAVGATSARIAASRDGWKFAEYSDIPRNQKGPRLWDSCAECPIPESSAAAIGLKKKPGGAA
jgi:hypothetical protein